MSGIKGFRREDGTLGIRNHLFILPAVVCANQVAIDVARRHSALKYIEHQHGCAQIGADLIQTQRVFSNLSIHPNTYASVFVGLGCEGIIAKELYAKTKERSAKALQLVIIQESGGTLGAESAVENWLLERQQELSALPLVDATWSDLRVGLLFDEITDSAKVNVHEWLGALWDLGVNFIVPDTHSQVLAPFETPTTCDYGEAAQGRNVAMKAGSNELETATGLTASGAHVLVHFVGKPHAFGIPLAPMVRYGIDETAYGQFAGDWDGKLTDVSQIPGLVEQLAQIVSGEASAAEELGMDDFALYRIGPTV